MNGPVNITVNIEDFCDGFYLASYVALIAGEYTLNVALDNVVFYSEIILIGTTERKFDILQGGSSAANSQVYGSGLSCGNGGNTFSVQVYDSIGVLVDYGGDNITVHFESVDGGLDLDSFVVVAVNDNYDGTYAITYTPFFSGAFLLYVYLNGDPIRGSPFASTCPITTPCDSDCNGNGVCVVGTCVCVNGYTGESCNAGTQR